MNIEEVTQTGQFPCPICLKQGITKMVNGKVGFRTHKDWVHSPKSRAARIAAAKAQGQLRIGTKRNQPRDRVLGTSRLKDRREYSRQWRIRKKNEKKSRNNGLQHAANSELTTIPAIQAHTLTNGSVPEVIQGLVRATQQSLMLAQFIVERYPNG